MKKTIEIDYGIHNIVRIKPLEKINGTIIGIWISCEGIQYKVSYFNNGDPKEAYLLPSQIEDVK